MGLPGGFKGNCKGLFICQLFLLSCFPSHPPIFNLLIHSIHWFYQRCVDRCMQSKLWLSGHGDLHAAEEIAASCIATISAP